MYNFPGMFNGDSLRETFERVRAKNTLAQYIEREGIVRGDPERVAEKLSRATAEGIGHAEGFWRNSPPDCDILLDATKDFLHRNPSMTPYVRVYKHGRLGVCRVEMQLDANAKRPNLDCQTRIL